MATTGMRWRLTELSVLGYRGFSRPQPPVRFAVPNGKPGSGLTALVGPNNAGKSALLEVLGLLKRNPDTIRFTEGKFSSGGNENININAVFDFMDAEGVASTADMSVVDRSLTIQSEGGNPRVSREVGKSIASACRRIAVLPSRRQINRSFGWSPWGERDAYVDNMTPSLTRGPTTSGVVETLLALQDQTDAQKKRRREFDDFVREIVGEKVRWAIKLADSEDYYLQIEQGGVFHKSEGMGDGLASLLFLACALFDANDEDLLVIDEPELSLHPQYVHRLCQAIMMKAQRTQIVIATHSPLLVSGDSVANGGEIVRVAKSWGPMFDGPARFTTTHQLSVEGRSALLALRGGLGNPHLLGSDAREAFFLDGGIAVVEGQDDVSYYSHMAQQLGISPLPFSFFGWGSGGVGNVPHVAQVLRDLGYARVIAILDSPKPDASEADRRQLDDVKAKLHALNVPYHQIPTADVRDKPPACGKAQVLGLTTKNGDIKPEHEVSARNLFTWAQSQLDLEQHVIRASSLSPS
jgi:ABC-type branched-subunit amino acid transport system ATPase component